MVAPRRRVVVFNKDEEADVQDITRRVLADFPDDVDDDEDDVVRGAVGRSRNGGGGLFKSVIKSVKPRRAVVKQKEPEFEEEELYGDEDEVDEDMEDEVEEEELPVRRPVARRPTAVRQKKVLVKKPSVVRRVAPARPAASRLRSRVSGVRSMPRRKPVNIADVYGYAGDAEDIIDEEPDLIDYADDVRDNGILGEEERIENGQLVRYVYVQGSPKKGPVANRNTRLPTRFSAGIASRITIPNPRIGRVPLSLGRRIAFPKGARASASTSSSRVSGGRIRKNVNVLSETDNPNSRKLWNAMKVLERNQRNNNGFVGRRNREEPRRNIQQVERFEPFMKACSCKDTSHRHKGRGFQAGSMRAFD